MVGLPTERGDRPRWEVRPFGGRPASSIQVAIEEALPAPQSVDRDFERKVGALEGIGELVEVEHPLVPSVDGDDDIDVEVTEDVATALVLDGEQVDVPGVLPERIGLDSRAVLGHRMRPARIRETHAHIEEHERALNAAAAGPRHEALGELELVGDDVAHPEAGQRTEQGLAITPDAAHDLGRFGLHPRVGALEGGGRPQTSRTRRPVGCQRQVRKRTCLIPAAFA